MNVVEEYFRVAESKGVKILFWLLHNRDADNIILATMDSVAEDCKVTKVTVNRIFQKLYAAGFLEKIHNGQYQLKRI